MKIAICGLAPSQVDAPWSDPSWEKWCLPWSDYWSAADRLFEIHDWDYRKTFPPGNFPTREIPDYIEWVESRPFDVPLYMRDAQFGRRYPIEAVIRTIGRDYFESSPSYMVALALHEGADEIGLWGVDMSADSEYAYQRPNMEWLLGKAEAMGVRVHLPGSCPLLKFNGHMPNNMDPGPQDRKLLRYGQWER